MAAHLHGGALAQASSESPLSTTRAVTIDNTENLSALVDLACRCPARVQAALWSELHAVCRLKLLNRRTLSRSGLLGKLARHLATLDGSGAAAAAAALCRVIAEGGAFHLATKELRELLRVIQSAGRDSVSPASLASALGVPDAPRQPATESASSRLRAALRSLRLAGCFLRR